MNAGTNGGFADGLGYADDGDELAGSDFESDEGEMSEEDNSGQVGKWLLPNYAEIAETHLG